MTNVLIIKIISILRLCVALKYYSLLNPVNNPQQQDTFTNFTSTIYTNLLDDYIHFIKQHQHQIEEIQNELTNNNGFTKCNIKNCDYTSRHHRVDQKLVNNDNNEENGPFDFLKKQWMVFIILFFIFLILD